MVTSKFYSFMFCTQNYDLFWFFLNMSFKSRPIMFHRNAQLLKHRFMKTLTFLKGNAFATLAKINEVYISGLFHSFYSYLYLFASGPFSYWSFIISHKTGYCKSSNFIVIFQNCFSYSSSSDFLNFIWKSHITHTGNIYLVVCESELY